MLSVAPLNVVLISDAVAQAQQVRAAAAKDTIAIVYHADTMTTAGLVALLASVSVAHNGARIGHLGIVAHGRPGEVDLGNAVHLSLATMPRQAAALERLRSILTSDARVDLFACSVAAGPRGRTLVDELSAVTGAAVFASSNPVGTTPDSDLAWEYHMGHAVVSAELLATAEMEMIRGLSLPTVPQFSQRDPSWAADPVIDDLGSTGETIRSVGCAMTCTAMLAEYYGTATADPKTLNAWLNTNQGYVAARVGSSYSRGNLDWAKPAEYSGGRMTYMLNLAWTSQPPYSDNDHWSDLKRQLDQGYPVIVEVDAHPSTPALDNHWVLVTSFLGGSTTSPSSYAINDPDNGTTTTLAKYYDGTYDNTFFGIRVYHGSALTTTYSLSPNPATVTEGAGTLSFTVTRSGGLPAETLYANTTMDQGYTNSGDYTPLRNQNVVFAANQTQATVTVWITNDQAVESNETFGLIVQRCATDPISAYLARSTFTIVDNEVPLIPGCQGVDYSLARPSPAALKAAGYTFVVR